MEPVTKPDPAPDELDYYAPPRGESGPSGPGRDVEADVVPFDLGCIVAATWSVFKRRLWPSVGIAWTAYILVLAFGQVQSLVTGRLSPADRPTYYFVYFAFFFGGSVFSTWISLGQNLAFLAIARGEEAPNDRLFQGWPFVLTSLLAGLVLVGLMAGVALIVLAPAALLAEVAGRSILPVVLGGVVAMVAIAYVALRTWQFAYFIVDRNLGVMDSLRASWWATGRGPGTVLLLYLTVFAANLAGLLCFVVGLIFSIPFTTLLLAVGYLSLTGQPLRPLEAGPDSPAE
ncbi:hypothetical protein OJF2_24600 [Aquisphaera giovannonii]|uniref:Glycerophosphoryl diester phosphodiesterase membrane domain-containing protein n=1 Tax=Aquisphaera giovannonii TaxID=406548 RepID=A0A5B9W052_9BACT|nr:hypothetical protein [Aquisphaera giovannonii]QEH33928.1 hypothetical protein OJF2_24600 [Aquisphaera giovannonii]